MADVSEVGFEDGLGSCSLASFVTCGVEHSASVAKESLTQILEAWLSHELIWGTLNCLSSGYRKALYAGVERSAREADYTTSRSEVKNAEGYSSTPSNSLLACCLIQHRIRFLPSPINIEFKAGAMTLLGTVVLVHFSLVYERFTGVTWRVLLLFCSEISNTSFMAFRGVL